MNGIPTLSWDAMTSGLKDDFRKNGWVSRFIWLVVFRPTPLKNMRKSVGMMTFPTVSGKSIQIPWFQSPPTSFVSQENGNGWFMVFHSIFCKLIHVFHASSPMVMFDGDGNVWFMFSGDSIYHHPTTRQFQGKFCGFTMGFFIMKCFNKPPFGDFQNTLTNP